MCCIRPPCSRSGRHLPAGDAGGCHCSMHPVPGIVARLHCSWLTGTIACAADVLQPRGPGVCEDRESNRARQHAPLGGGEGAEGAAAASRSAAACRGSPAVAGQLPAPDHRSSLQAALVSQPACALPGVWQRGCSWAPDSALWASASELRSLNWYCSAADLQQLSEQVPIAC